MVPYDLQSLLLSFVFFCTIFHPLMSPLQQCNHQHEKNMIPIPLLVFHVAHVFGNAKSLVNLITM